MRLMYEQREYDAFDASTNPEIILMRQQDDEQECDLEDSMWHAGTAVTKPKLNDY